MRARGFSAALVVVCVFAAGVVFAGVAAAAPVAGENCPNAQIREEQHAMYLSDCRAYERVSPEEKGGGDIVADGETTIAGDLGEEAFKRGEAAITFDSRTPFGDEVGSGVVGQTAYVARRGSGGWSSHAVTPPERTDALQTLSVPTRIDTFSADLSRAVVWAYDLPGGGGPPERGIIYQEDVASRALQPVTLSQVEPLGPFTFAPANVRIWGVSADAQHMAFVTSRQMLPNAAPEEASNVYEWDAGKGLSLAGILPDGTVPPGGSYITPEYYRASMSSDGSRLVFTAAPEGEPELYMRIDGSVTVPISQPVGFPPSTGVSLQYVTPDGRNVFFVTESPLVPSDTNSGPDLYRWTDSGDAAHDGTLTAISTSGEVVNDGIFTGVIGASDDGTRVYYVTLGSKLFVWDNGTSRLINSDVAEDPNAKGGYSLAATAPGQNGTGPGAGRVTPDGMWLAFVSHATRGTDGVHSLTGQVSNGHYEMYVYSLADETLNCVSCSAAAVSSNASVVPDVTSGIPYLYDVANRPRFLSDGGKVFFSTATALVPEDVNGVEDVYEYDAPTGKLSLVSTGAGKDPSSFADASPGAEDVFIQTRQQLVPEDRDNLVDMYDVRVGGGFPASLAPTSCSGDECQPQPSPAPSFGVAATVGFAGAGNLPVPVGKQAVKRVSRAQKRASALRACRKRRGEVRKRCEARARKRYGKKSSRGLK